MSAQEPGAGHKGEIYTSCLDRGCDKPSGCGHQSVFDESDHKAALFRVSPHAVCAGVSYTTNR